MCSGREFQVGGTEKEKAHDEKLLVMPYGLSIVLIMWRFTSVCTAK